MLCSCLFGTLREYAFMTLVQPPGNRPCAQATEQSRRLLQELEGTRGTPALLDVIARAAACNARGGRFVKADVLAAGRAVMDATGQWDPAVAAAFGGLLQKSV